MIRTLKQRVGVRPIEGVDPEAENSVIAAEEAASRPKSEIVSFREMHVLYLDFFCRPFGAVVW